MQSKEQRFRIVESSRIYEKGASCPGHDFSDVPLDRAKRLQAHQLQCRRCGIVVPVLGAWLYEQGVRHGSERAA